MSDPMTVNTVSGETITVRDLVLRLDKAEKRDAEVKRKIDAALALHFETESPGGMLECVCGWSWSGGQCHSPTVKALKGEK